MTRLCVPIFVHSLEQAKGDVARAIEAGADLVELRLDHVADVSTAIDLQATFSNTDFLLTRRPERQGGHGQEADAIRLNWLRDARGDFRNWVDVEADCDRAVLHRHFLDYDVSRVIISQHDFKTRPADLTKRFIEMQESGAAIIKLAWQARSIRDNVEAFELMQSGANPTIAICMGDAGAISRILAPKFGAFLTFASLADTSATAPGQLTIDELKNTYRWDAIRSTTKVFGVVGAPVGHSMSPAVHNAAFDAIGFDGVYVPLLVQPGYESFKAFMETFRAFAPLDLAGLSITIPHKENALRYARESGDFAIDPVAARIGAVNTYVLAANEMRTVPGPNAADVGAGTPRLSINRALSTDYAAILDTIVAALAIGHEDLCGLRVAILGAGGTGRTAVAACADAGARVTIVNRTRDRADALAAEFGATAAPIDAIGSLEADVWINATSLGMSPHVDASGFDAALPPLTNRSLVFDAVYNPLETKLLRIARERGARVAGGVEMFVRQAAAQFESWTGVSAPVDVMRDAVVRRLRPPG